MELKFRNLTKEEIEVRVGGGKSLLLYKTARVDAKMLDETVGAFNWQKRFYQVKNTMICEILINANYQHPELPPIWIAKSDGGDDDFTMEKVKGECSDSFKRAGFAWGIGRNLYTAPKIKIPDQFKDAQFFDLELIEYDKDDNISKLVITTNFGKDIVFSYPKGANTSQNAQNNPKSTIGSGKGTIRPSEKDKIANFIAGLDADKLNMFINWLNKTYHTTDYNTLSNEEGVMVVTKWKM